MKEYAVIVAGGCSTRFGGELPKQFVEIGGKPMLMYGIEAFHHYSSSIPIVVVLPKVYTPLWEQLLEKHRFSIPHTVINGGEHRISSVKNGLASLPNNQKALVAIHDGARPLIDKSLIDKLFTEAKQFGNAVPYVAPTDSVRLQNPNETSRFIDRTIVKLIQTPQVFDLAFLRNAYDNIQDDLTFTDDASVVEYAGAKIHLIQGTRENIKITFPEDLLWAEWFLKNRN